MAIVTVLSSKGGTGKTTISFCLASFLHHQGVSVALCDMDPQQSIRIIEDSGIPIIDYDDISESDYQIIIVDSPPYRMAGNEQLLRKSDFIIVPLIPSLLDLVAVNEIIEDIRYYSRTKYGVVLNRVTPGTSITDKIRQALDDKHIRTFNSMIHSRVSYQRAILMNSLFGPADDKAINEIELLAGELFRKMTL